MHPDVVGKGPGVAQRSTPKLKQRERELDNRRDPFCPEPQICCVFVCLFFCATSRLLSPPLSNSFTCDCENDEAENA